MVTRVVSTSSSRKICLLSPCAYIGVYRYQAGGIVISHLHTSIDDDGDDDDDDDDDDGWSC